MLTKIRQMPARAVGFLAGCLTALKAKLRSLASRVWRKKAVEPCGAMSALTAPAQSEQREPWETRLSVLESTLNLRLAVLEDGFAELVRRLPRKEEKPVRAPRRASPKPRKHKKKT